MVFDGVRAEESDARATYSMVSDGNKHAVQYNCSPILEWGTCELFLYILQNNYKKQSLTKEGLKNSKKEGKCSKDPKKQGKSGNQGSKQRQEYTK